MLVFLKIKLFNNHGMLCNAGFILIGSYPLIGPICGFCIFKADADWAFNEEAIYLWKLLDLNE